jgi:fibronectin type 3 domain-containing protein
VGPPKPPALDIPTRITDLRAAEYGDQILVQFTIGALTTDGLPLTNVKAVEVQVTGGDSPRMLHAAAKGRGPVAHEFPAKDWVGKQVTLVARATGPKGKASEWSNAVTLAVGVPLPTPADFKAVSDPKGVRLTWLDSPGSGRYRIFRGAGDAMPQRLAESDKAEYLDTAVDFGSPYRYFVQALAGEFQQSEISAIVGVTPADAFPPAVPVGLMAVAGVNSIELAWQPNTEEDLAGYQVYRSTSGGAAERIAGPVDAPNFSDRTVEIGKKYSYAITSIDRTGNESAHSAAVEVTGQ